MTQLIQFLGAKPWFLGAFGVWRPGRQNTAADIFLAPIPQCSTILKWWLQVRVVHLIINNAFQIIPQNKRRSNKWVSTSVPEEDWDSNLARFNSPEYHTNNLLRPVLFEGIIKHIPSNAVLIEIAPHGLLQAVLKRAVPENTTNVSLTHRSSPNGVQFFLEAIGEWVKSFIVFILTSYESVVFKREQVHFLIRLT